MLTMKLILGRVSRVIRLTANKDIAAELGVDPNVCSQWKTRNTIPWEDLFDFTKRRNISFDWLLTGKEFAKPEPQDNETRQAMEAVKEIMASKHDIVIPALQANLAAFKCTVRIDKENKQGEKENKKIKKENRSLRKDVDILGRKVDRLDHLNNPRAQGATGTESGTDT